MRPIAILLLSAKTVCCSFSGQFEQATAHALRSLGQPVHYWPKVMMRGEILQKPIPEAVTVYKVVPRKISDATLDELLKATELNRSQTFQGANRGVFGTPGVRYYGSLENNHTLAIIPAQGWIHYTRLEAVDDKGNKTLQGPTEEETLRRGLEFAKLLGLKESDFARHPIENRLDYRFLKTEGGPVRLEPRVKSMEVFFRRAIDGHPVATGRLYGGLWVGFGFHGMLYKFELTARAVEPMDTIKLASLSEQFRAITEGKQTHAVRWPVDPEELKKDKEAVLELDFVELVYFEDAPEKFQKIIPPLLRWEGELSFKGQRHLVVLFTPVKPRKRAAEFPRESPTAPPSKS